MSFVPEWIPVLKALESQRSTRLPFDDGKYLNLWREDPVTFNSCVAGTSPDVVFASCRASIVGEMVEESLLEPIREIRLDAKLKNELVEKLSNLVNETTLDKMQFVSFVDAFRNPVHLTQGPYVQIPSRRALPDLDSEHVDSHCIVVPFSNRPGTGKSYLGVVLVRALMIVRELWMKKSRSVGSPPILVLAYKNLAVDNFLVDLVKSEPVALARNKLIRIGGSCKDPRLDLYSERNSSQSDAQVKAKRCNVERLNRLRESIQANLSGSVASFLSFQPRMFVEGDEKARRQAGNMATSFLMESIIRRRLLIDSSTSAENDQECAPTSVIDGLSFMEIDRDRKACRVLQRLVDAPDSGATFVSKLVDEGLHYHEEHWGDMLLMWLYGKKPLPRCIFVQDDDGPCGALALSHDVSLCDAHRCFFESNDIGRCTSACVGNGSFCNDHCCQIDRCCAPRLGGLQKYCDSHSCKKCVELGLPARPCIDKPPRNVCEIHPLCTFPSCLEFCVAGGIYCGEHNIVKCMATTKKGKPCRGEPMSRYKPFCRDHLHWATSLNFDTVSIDSEESEGSEIVEPRDASPKEVRSKCVAMTKKGLPCKGQPLPGSIYCYDHAPPLAFDGAGTFIAATHDSSSPTSQVASKMGDNVESSAANIVSHEDGGSSAFSQPAATTSTVGPVGSDAFSKSDRITSAKSGVSHSLDDGDDALSAASSKSSGTVLIGDESRTKTAAEVDELDLDFEEGENLQHLREVFEIQSEDDDDSSLLVDADGAEETSLDDASSEASFYSTAQDLVSFRDPSNWTWDMPLDQRWRACRNLMEDLRIRMSEANLRVKRALVVARYDLQQAKVRAKARVYENKSVIGGTSE